jgi:hypothetical protein
MTQTIENKVSSRIFGNGRGWACSQKDFVDLGGTSTIHWALYELEKAGTIRRVLRGIYDYPRLSKLLDAALPPDIHQVAKALARKFGWRIQPGGAAALNLLDLSTQVPSRFQYFSDGPSREYLVGKTTLEFRHQALKNAVRHDETAVLLQALKELGTDQIDAGNLQQMRDWLPGTRRRKVLRDARGTSAWIFEALTQICREDEDG